MKFRNYSIFFQFTLFLLLFLRHSSAELYTTENKEFKYVDIEYNNVKLSLLLKGRMLYFDYVMHISFQNYFATCTKFIVDTDKIQKCEIYKISSIHWTASNNTW